MLLERNGRRAIAPFGALVYEPVNNVYVHPNDTIYLYREPQTFLASARSARSNRFPSGPGGCRLRKRSARPAVWWISRLTRPRYSSIAVKRATLLKRMGIDCCALRRPRHSRDLYDQPARSRRPISWRVRSRCATRTSSTSRTPFSVESTKFMNYLNTDQHHHPGAHHDRHQRLWLAEYHPRHRRGAQHLHDRRNDYSRHDANAVRPRLAILSMVGDRPGWR